VLPLTVRSCGMFEVTEAFEFSCPRFVVRALKEFLKKYREALCRFVTGEKDAVFPAGTYLMRVRVKVNCAPA